MSDPIDLSDVDTGDLLDELLRRHHHGGFIGGNYDPHEANVIRRRWRGNPHTIAGLLADLIREILDEAARDARRLDGGRPARFDPDPDDPE